MCRIEIVTIGEVDISEQLLEGLSKILSDDEPEGIESVREFWHDWFSERIEGEKFTIVAAERGAMDDQKFLGVVRLWRTPYCGNKWFIEGLEVIAPKRKQGIGQALVRKAIGLLVNAGYHSVSANIRRDNWSSVALHRSVGFSKFSTGATNSYGEYRHYSDEYVLRIRS